MRTWFQLMASEVLLSLSFATPKNDPVACLDAATAKSPAKARQGLGMAINDLLELIDDSVDGKVQELDSALCFNGLPSLTEMRIRFSKTLRRVVVEVLKTMLNIMPCLLLPSEPTARQSDLSALLLVYEAQAEKACSPQYQGCMPSPCIWCICCCIAMIGAGSEIQELHIEDQHRVGRDRA